MPRWTVFGNRHKDTAPLHNFATFVAFAFSSLSPQSRKDKSIILGSKTFMRICRGALSEEEKAGLDGCTVE